MGEQRLLGFVLFEVSRPVPRRLDLGDPQCTLAQVTAHCLVGPAGGERVTVVVRGQANPGVAGGSRRVDPVAEVAAAHGHGAEGEVRHGTAGAHRTNTGSWEPAQTCSTSPVILAAWSEARNATAFATSCGRTSSPSGVSARTRSA